MRIAQIMSTPFLLVANQLWPIYARLIANRDRRLLRYILFLSCAAGVAIAIACAVGLNLFGREMLQVLTPNFSAKYPGAWTNALGLGAALLVGANVVLAPLVVFLNGAGLLRPQLTASIAFIAIALPLKAWFAYQGSPAMMLTTTALLFVGLNLLSVFWLHGAKFRETVRML
jgi:O-antigen/teichoic acid export membrane protein